MAQIRKNAPSKVKRSKMVGLLAVASAAAVELLMRPHAASAQSYTWTAGAGLWGTGANWFGSAGPAGTDTADDLTFTGTSGGLTLNANAADTANLLTAVNSLTFSSAAGAYTVGAFSNATALSIGAGGITNYAAASQTVSQSLFLSTSSTFSNALSSGAMIFNGGINTGSSATSLIFGGLGGSSIGTGGITGLGGVTVSSGTVYVLSGSSLNAGFISLSGGTLDTTQGGVIDNNTGFSMSGGSLTSGSGALANRGGVYISGGAATIGSGGITGTGSVIVSGGSLVMASNNNTFSGGLVLTGGTASAIAGNFSGLTPFGAAASAITLASGTLNFTNNTGAAQGTLGNTIVVASSSTISYTSTNTYPYGPVVLSNISLGSNATTLTVDDSDVSTNQVGYANAGIVMNGSISGAGNISFTRNNGTGGADAIQLTGVDSYTGNTVVNPGVILELGASSLSGGVTLNGGALAIYNNGNSPANATNIVLGAASNTIEILTNGVQTSFTGSILTASSVTSAHLTFDASFAGNGAPNQYIYNTGNSWTGGTTLLGNAQNGQGNALFLIAANALGGPNAGLTTIYNTQGNPSNINIFNNQTWAGLSNAGSVNDVGNISAGTGLGVGSRNDALVLNNVASPQVYSGSLSHYYAYTLSLVKSGTGIQAITGYNNVTNFGYTGGTTVTGGTLQISSDVNLGIGGPVVLNGGTLETSTGLTGVSPFPPFFVNGATTGTSSFMPGGDTSGAAQSYLPAMVTYTGGVADVSVVSGGAYSTAPTSITAPGGFLGTVTSSFVAGMYVITGINIVSIGSGYTSSPNFTVAGGGTVTTNASLLADAFSILGGNISSTGFNVGTPTTLDENAQGIVANPTIGSSRVISIGSGGGTFQVDSGSTLTYLGTSLSGSGAIYKSAAGAMILGGNNTLYTGAFTVQQGSVQLTGGTASLGAASAIIVGDSLANSAATLDVTNYTGNAGVYKIGTQTVSGEGSLLGSYLLASGSTTSPGNADYGKLTAGTLSIAAGATLNYQLSSTAGSNSTIATTNLWMPGATTSKVIANLSGLGSVGVGSYNLITYGTYTGFGSVASGTSNITSLFSVTGGTLGANESIVDNGNADAIQLVVLGAPSNPSINVSLTGGSVLFRNSSLGLAGTVGNSGAGVNAFNYTVTGAPAAVSITSGASGSVTSGNSNPYSGSVTGGGLSLGSNTLTITATDSSQGLSTSSSVNVTAYDHGVGTVGGSISPVTVNLGYATQGSGTSLNGSSIAVGTQAGSDEGLVYGVANSGSGITGGITGTGTTVAPGSTNSYNVGLNSNTATVGTQTLTQTVTFGDDPALSSAAGYSTSLSASTVNVTGTVYAIAENTSLGSPLIAPNRSNVGTIVLTGSPTAGYFGRTDINGSLGSQLGQVTISTAGVGGDFPSPHYFLLQFQADGAPNIAASAMATLESDLSAYGYIYEDHYGNTDATGTALADMTQALAANNADDLALAFDPPTGDQSFDYDFSNYNLTAYNVAAVPEPGSLALLGLGAIGLLGRRRSRRSRKAETVTTS